MTAPSPAVLARQIPTSPTMATTSRSGPSRNQRTAQRLPRTSNIFNISPQNQGKAQRLSRTRAYSFGTDTIIPPLRKPATWPHSSAAGNDNVRRSF